MDELEIERLLGELHKEDTPHEIIDLTQKVPLTPEDHLALLAMLKRQKFLVSASTVPTFTHYTRKRAFARLFLPLLG